MSIVVTGIGTVSAIGVNVQETLDSLAAKKSGLRPLSWFESNYKDILPVGEVKASNRELVERLNLNPGKTWSRTALLGMLAAQEAFDNANLSGRKQENLRIGFISGTSVGGMDLSENFYSVYRQSPFKSRLRDVVSHDCGDSSEKIASFLGINDYVSTISTACSSGANAVIVGARLIEHGLLDCVIVGGTDALCRFTLNGFASLKIVDEQFCRPFDASRQGLNLGEGAGYLVLEKHTNDYPQSYAYLSGYANSCEAFHQTASSPGGEGALLSMQKALAMQGILPEQIDYINLHGTGTPNNDLAEGMAVKKLFGEKLPYFSSTKAFTGHTLGACGGIEAVFSVLAIQKGIVLPNLNFSDAIPEHGLIPETCYLENRNIRTVMSNSFGFGGSMSSLIFSSEKFRHCMPNLSFRAKKVNCYISSQASINPLFSIETALWPDAVESAGTVRLSCKEPDYKTCINDPASRRRMSRAVKMGVAAALQCLSHTEKTPDAIVTATDLGCLGDTEKFLRTIIENKEELLNPTPFIQSTFNAVGAQIAMNLKNTAYNNTYVHRGFSFGNALLDALMMLEEETAKNVLVGSYEEITDTSFDVMSRLGFYRRGGKAGEGAQFFMLSTEEQSPCLLRDIAFAFRPSVEDLCEKATAFLHRNKLHPEDIDLLISGESGNAGEQAFYDGVANGFPQASLAKYKHLTGDYQTVSSFALWLSVQILKTDSVPAYFLSENKSRSIGKILIYNHFRNDEHLFVLVEGTKSPSSKKHPL
jgi:3-oxoacyl-[acyl-carrier-protein] synthase-1